MTIKTPEIDVKCQICRTKVSKYKCPGCQHRTCRCNLYKYYCNNLILKSQLPEPAQGETQVRREEKVREVRFQTGFQRTEIKTGLLLHRFDDASHGTNKEKIIDNK